MRLAFFIAVAVLGALCAGSPGQAAPTSCGGPSAKPGDVVRGPVLLVPDASSLCLAGGPSPDTWTRVTLPQAGATRGMLMAAAFGKNATCRIAPGGDAVCRIEGRSLAEELRRPTLVKAALDWR